ncbi:hypothetical protein LO772_18700 [Yinghuangia sp. ASG 101]|uniref:hypothetical protein n=1 Tax=Yinghuangia sp. ASG 101 TaxID=2896848 RepID=UPI001E4408E2|nr:hypothetical protein [Yinghuangia sp. ASG 101]UGQ09004.1 hypothetical protein LO772_18700 [Yinghuangia sp. ASG 101]
MANTIRSLLWHAGPSLGAEILGRLGVPVAVRGAAHGRGHEHVPPAVVEHALRVGDVDIFVGLHQRYGNGKPPGDVDVLLRLLEHDDPEINASLFRRSSWPALREAVMSQRRFAPVPDPEVADTPVPLSPALRESVLAQGARGDLQAALSSVDPELVFLALVSGVPGGAHGGPKARIRACTTLARQGRRAQLRQVFHTAPIELPPDSPPELEQELRGARTYALVDELLNAEYGPEALCTRLANARRTAHGRAAVRGVLEPPWAELERRHAADPLPWGAAVALLEHPRCPAALRAALLHTHPRAVQSVARPGHEVLAVCHAMGEDQLTKKVLLRGIDSGTIGPEHLVTEIRPARIALTALVHGGLGAVATQGAAIRLVRALLSARSAQDPGVWRELYTALPGFTGTAAELIAGAGSGAAPAPDSVPGPALPALGRQSAWAYTALIDIAGPESTLPALEFLDDARLAPLAGSRELPQPLAEYVVAHGGPVARRVLAGNPAIRVDLLDHLARGGDPAVAAAVYRNPRCPLPLRRAVLAADGGIDPGLRAELLAEQRAVELWPLLASSDPALLRHLVFAWTGEFERIPRLRAAHRIAVLHGPEALRGLPDLPEITAVRESGSPDGLRDLLLAHDKTWLDHLTQTRYLPYRREADGIHGALADPGLRWPQVVDAARAGEIDESVHNALAERPDHPVELARLRVAAHQRTGSGGTVDCRDIARHRSLAAAFLEPPDDGVPADAAGVDAAHLDAHIRPEGPDTRTGPTAPRPAGPPTAAPPSATTPSTGATAHGTRQNPAYSPAGHPAESPRNTPDRDPAHAPAPTPVLWAEAPHALDTGALTVAEFVATGDAASVIDVSGEYVPVARAVARILNDELGDAVDAWVVLAHLVRQRTPATLAEVVATARAAA